MGILDYKASSPSLIVEILLIVFFPRDLTSKWSTRRERMRGQSPQG